MNAGDPKRLLVMVLSISSFCVIIALWGWMRFRAPEQATENFFSRLMRDDGYRIAEPLEELAEKAREALQNASSTIGLMLNETTTPTSTDEIAPTETSTYQFVTSTSRE